MAKKEVTTPAVEKTRKIVDHYFDVIVSPILTRVVQASLRAMCI